MLLPSITVDGTTFECNIQTDGTWDVVLPFVAYTEGENGTLFLLIFCTRWYMHILFIMQMV